MFYLCSVLKKKKKKKKKQQQKPTFKSIFPGYSISGYTKVIVTEENKQKDCST